MVPMAILFTRYRRWHERQGICFQKRSISISDKDYQTLHFWNTTTAARLNSLTTNSQVTSIIFNPHAKELVSSHGFPDNQLSIWSYPTLTKIADINQAHDTRVLHSALSPDGCTVATASSDENLKSDPFTQAVAILWLISST